MRPDPVLAGWFAFLFTAWLACSPVHAENNPPPGATLEAKFTCSLQPVWNDKRSRADLDGFFYLPNVGPTEYLIGGYGNRNKTLLASDCVLTLDDPAYLAAPAGWELIWKDKGSGARLDGSMWRAVPPSEDYRCVGHVPQEGYDEPYIPNYRCVHAAFTEQLVTSELIWSDKGSGADKQVTMLYLPNTRSFVAVGARVEQLEAYDLRVGHSTGTGDVVVVQAESSASPASETADAEPADEEAGNAATTEPTGMEADGMAVTDSTDKEASSAAVAESADVETEAGQPPDTTGTEAQPDADNDEESRLKAAVEAALAAGDLDQAADHLARLRALRPDSPAVAEGNQEPPTAQPAQADGKASEPGEQADAQAEPDATGTAPQPTRQPEPQADGTDSRYSGEMVTIPGGAFRMGDLSGAGSDSEKPAHDAEIPAFRLGKHEVTFAQWDACVADGGCGNYRPADGGWGRGNQPMINVSWDDVQSFIEWLNGKTDGGYRLPTEAEWEYAARAGGATKYHFGDDESQLCEYANHADANTDFLWRNESCSDEVDKRTAEVGQYQPNSHGLHDMHGNVSEWVQDCWNETYAGAPGDGSARQDGDCDLRVVRGGSWDSSSRNLRSAYRHRHTRTFRFNFLGFRLARDE